MVKNEKVVTISGSVNNPGKYELKKDMTVIDLVLEAGGVDNDYSSFRAEINRQNNFQDFESDYVDIIVKDFNNKLSLYSKKSV